MKNARPFMIVAAAVAGVAAVAAASCFLFDWPWRWPDDWTSDPGTVRTLHRSGLRPDNIVLTPVDDTRHTATVTWRTSEVVEDGVVQYARADGGAATAVYREAAARRRVLFSSELLSDNTVHCHTATLTGLAPGAVYRYRVGSHGADAWSDYHTFSTAPADAGSFSFVYFGDSQKYPARFGALVAAVERRHPEAAFYTVAGDIVDMGDLRNLWDEFLAVTRPVFAHKPFAPAFGDNDFGHRRHGPVLFNAYFGLPDRDADGEATPLHYSFQYDDAYFIVADPFDIEGQAVWMEEELRAAEALGCDFIVVISHVPVYHAKVDNENRGAEEHWVPLFDRYGVDLVLSGNDHSYMRTVPMRGGAPAEGGTVYVVATACEKFYTYRERDFAACQFGDAVTYQLVTLGDDAAGRPAIRYECRNAAGELLDHFETVKITPSRPRREHPSTGR